MGSATRPWRAEAAVVEAARMASVLSTALERAFGHINMGVYAEVMAGGEIAVGDALGDPSDLLHSDRRIRSDLLPPRGLGRLGDLVYWIKLPVTG